MAEMMVLADFSTLVEEEVAARVAIERGRPVPEHSPANAQTLSGPEIARRRRQIHEEESGYRAVLRRQAAAAREAGRPGTMPAAFLMTEQAKLCRDFLDYMKERHDFAGATELHNRVRFRRSRDWSIRGYGIGHYPVGWDALRTATGEESLQRRVISLSPDHVVFGDTLPKEARVYEAILPGTTGEYNAFLCEDDLVRLWICRKADRNIDNYGATYVGDDPPSVIRDLPRANDLPRSQALAPWLTRTLVNYAVEAELTALAPMRLGNGG
jgi:hypothetical protein